MDKACAVFTKDGDVKMDIREGWGGGRLGDWDCHTYTTMCKTKS